MSTLTAVPEVISIANDGLDAVEKALDLYNKMIEQVIPWETFENTIHDLQASQAQYSTAAAVLVGEVETHLLDSRDNYKSSVQEVLNWCRTAVPILRQYMKLFALTKRPGIAEAQKVLLLKVLNDGASTMDKAIADLKKSSLSFNGASGKLTLLKSQLEADFSKGSTYYEDQVAELRAKAYGGASASIIGGPIGLAIAYAIAAGIVEGDMIPYMEKAFADTKKSFEHTATLVSSAGNKIEKAKESIGTEIKTISKISSNIKLTATFAETWALVPESLFDDLKESADNLIRICELYIKAKSL